MCVTEIVEMFEAGQITRDEMWKMIQEKIN
jgi:hypothetical protein